MWENVFFLHEPLIFTVYIIDINNFVLIMYQILTIKFIMIVYLQFHLIISSKDSLPKVVNLIPRIKKLNLDAP